MKPGTRSHVCVRVAAAIFLISTFCRSAELREGLVSYWPFETISEHTTPDLVSHNDLYLYNVSSSNLVAGRFGNGVALNGSSEFFGLNYAQSDTLPIHSASSYTVAFWVKGPPNQTNRILFAEGLTTETKPLFLLGTDRYGASASINVLIRGKVVTYLDNVPSEAVVFDNTWHHVAWVDEDGTGKLYIDGMLDVTSFIYVYNKIPLNYLSVGALFRDPPKYFFKGEIDEVAIWQRGLSQKEIRELVHVQLNTILQPPQRPSEKTALN